MATWNNVMEFNMKEQKIQKMDGKSIEIELL